MFHSRLYQLFIGVILTALMLPTSIVQADTGQSVAPQAGILLPEIKTPCPPYNPEFANSIEYIDQLSPECREMYLNGLSLPMQTVSQIKPLTAFNSQENVDYRFSEGAYSWINASTKSQLVGDDAFSSLDIGFDFPFYGFIYSQLYFSTNGLISFGKGYSGYGALIPRQSAPNNIIAPFWKDLIVGVHGNEGAIYYQTYGSAPDRYFVLEWRNVGKEDDPSFPDLSFEAILYENGDIKFQYKSMPAASFCCPVEVGIQDSIGLEGLLWFLGIDEPPPTALLITHPTIRTARTFLSPLYQGGFAVPGGNRSFNLTVGNTGSMGTDTYDLVANSTWPINFYASDGLTPLTDTDGDGTIDTGPIAQSTTINIVVRSFAPENALVGDNSSCLVVATSSLETGWEHSAFVSFFTIIPASFASIFVDNDNSAMSFMTASRYQSINQKLTADNYNGSDIAMIRLLNGNYLYAWSHGRNNGSVWVHEIEYMIVSASGSTLRGVTRLQTHLGTASISDTMPSLAIAPDGTVGVALRRYIYSGVKYSYNVYFATLDSAGNRLTNPIAITSHALASNVPSLHDVTIAATDDNRFLMAWLDYHSSSDTYNLWIAGRNTAGVSVFSPKAFTEDNHSLGCVLNSLTGGKAILTWKHHYGGPFYAVLNSNGSTYKTATELISGWNRHFDYLPPDAVLLSNGKVAVAWSDGSSPQGVAYSILDPSYNIESGPHTAAYTEALPQAYSGFNGHNLSVTTDVAGHVIMSWVDGSAEQPLFYALGDSNGNYLTYPMPYKNSSSSLQTGWNGQGIAPFGYQAEINIGNSLMGKYEIIPGYSLAESYAAIQNGPVKVKTTEGKTFVPSERVIAGTSFNEVMGYPNNQLTTEYWFPWYDNVSMDTWILVGNPTTSTAAVDIYIGGVKRTSTTVPAEGNIKPRFNIPAAGPVRVVSTNGVKIFTSERTLYGPDSAFNEVMGYPANQFTTEYWYPWYDNTTMNTWILVGNPSTTSAAAVDIYIGGVKKGSYTIPKGGNVTPRFNLQAGPVRVVSTNGVPIFTSERTVTLASDGFNEVMGYPANQFTTEYWYPWYDNVNMDTWVLVGNPSATQTAVVEIWVGTSKVGTYNVAPKNAITPRYNRDAGPVRVVVTNGVKVFTSQRVLYGVNNAFNEVMGYPSNKLDSLYWFPWYDSSSMSTDIVVGMP